MRRGSSPPPRATALHTPAETCAHGSMIRSSMSKAQLSCSARRLCRYPQSRELSTGVRRPDRSLQRSRAGPPASMHAHRAGMTPVAGRRHMRRAVLGQLPQGIVP